MEAAFRSVWAVPWGGHDDFCVWHPGLKGLTPPQPRLALLEPDLGTGMVHSSKVLLFLLSFSSLVPLTESPLWAC